MKYRILSNEELSHLDEELKQFLIVHGIHHEEWVEMNHKTPTAAVELVELFSDTVLQKVYEKIEFLEFRSTDSCIVFHYKLLELELFSINKKPNSTSDLSTPETIHQSLTHQADQLTYFRSAKKYTATRELEIHQALEQGCVVSSREFWESLQEL